MKFIAIALLVLLSGTSYGAGVTVAPEVWYAKWNPGVVGDTVPRDRPADFSIGAAMLTGVSVSAVVGDFGITGGYLYNRNEGKSTSLAHEIKGELLSTLGPTVKLRNRVLSGRFSGMASYDVWERGGLATTKELSVDTNWVQGDAEALIHRETGKYTDFDLVAGYRYKKFSIPSRMDTIDVDGLQKTDLLDTEFVTNALLVGVEEVPGAHPGWSFAITRFAVGFGVTSAQNSRVRLSANTKSVGYILEGDIAGVYSAGPVDVSLGLRYSSYRIVLGEGKSDGSVLPTPGVKIALNEQYLGPFLKVAVRY